MIMIDPIKTELLKTMGIKESDIERFSKIPPPWDRNHERSISHEVAELISSTEIEYQKINLPLYRFSNEHGQIKIWAAVYKKTLFFAVDF